MLCSVIKKMPNGTLYKNDKNKIKSNKKEETKRQVILYI